VTRLNSCEVMLAVEGQKPGRDAMLEVFPGREKREKRVTVNGYEGSRWL
jgi:hypothetical protein